MYPAVESLCMIYAMRYGFEVGVQSGQLVNDGTRTICQRSTLRQNVANS